MSDKMGTRIRECRKEKGLTQEELGALVGVNKQAVNKWERGVVKNIKRSTIKQLADVFGVSPVWLMDYEDATKELENDPTIKAGASLISGGDELLNRLVSAYYQIDEDKRQSLVEFVEKMFCN